MGSDESVVMRLTKAERQAVLRAELSVGHGVRRSKTLLSAQRKLHEAVRRADGQEMTVPGNSTPA